MNFGRASSAEFHYICISKLSQVVSRSKSEKNSDTHAAYILNLYCLSKDLNSRIFGFVGSSRVVSVKKMCRLSILSGRAS